MDFDEWCWWLDEKFHGNKSKKKLTKKVKKFKARFEKAINRDRGYSAFKA